MDKEQALARLLMLESRLTKETNSLRGVTKKSTKEYEKALAVVCDMLDIDSKTVEDIMNP